MRWKAILYDTGYKQNRYVEKYWLKTLHSSKQVNFRIWGRFDSLSQDY